MNLSEHFTLEELTRSSTAVRLGIDNKARGEMLLTALRELANGLEEVRDLLDKPLTIDSGYRCEALNAVVRGAKDSAHMRGWAADFVCQAYGTPLDIVHKIERSPIQFDQCIQEGTWVHISFDPRMRRQVLTAHFTTAGVSYSQGA